VPSDDPVEPIVKHAIELAETLCRRILERALALSFTRLIIRTIAPDFLTLPMTV
jgi:hypothetical protein